MKKIFFVFLFVGLFFSCKKNTLPTDNATCTNVTVTFTTGACKHAAVIIDNKTYPTENLPDSLTVEGKKLCIEYTFYDDVRACVCCGGRYVNIIKVH